MSCGRPGCPTCYESWASRAGDRVAERIEECRRVAQEARVPGGGAVKHWAVSPPADIVAELVGRGVDVERVLREKMRKILADAGLVGGVDIFHPWRTKAKGVGKYRRGQNFFSPHFHVVGVGHLVEGSVTFERTGWIVKNLGVRTSVRKTIAYLLDHAGVRKRANGKSVPVPRWSGSMSTRRVVLDKEESEFAAMECDCGALLVEHPLTPNGDVDWSTSRGTAYAKVRRRRYRLAAALTPKDRNRLENGPTLKNAGMNYPAAEWLQRG